jgi:hypothetical protein
MNSASVYLTLPTVREKFPKKRALRNAEVQRNEEKTMKKEHKHDKSRMQGLTSSSVIFATYKQASDVVYNRGNVCTVLYTYLVGL